MVGGRTGVASVAQGSAVLSRKPRELMRRMRRYCWPHGGGVGRQRLWGRLTAKGVRRVRARYRSFCQASPKKGRGRGGGENACHGVGRRCSARAPGAQLLERWWAMVRDAGDAPPRRGDYKQEPPHALPCLLARRARAHGVCVCVEIYSSLRPCMPPCHYRSDRMCQLTIHSGLQLSSSLTDYSGPQPKIRARAQGAKLAETRLSVFTAASFKKAV